MALQLAFEGRRKTRRVDPGCERHDREHARAHRRRLEPTGGLQLARELDGHGPREPVVLGEKRCHRAPPHLEQLAVPHRLGARGPGRAGQQRELSESRPRSELSDDARLIVTRDDDTQPAGDDDEEAFGRVTLVEEPAAGIEVVPRCISLERREGRRLDAVEEWYIGQGRGVWSHRLAGHGIVGSTRSRPDATRAGRTPWSETAARDRLGRPLDDPLVPRPAPAAAGDRDRPGAAERSRQRSDVPYRGACRRQEIGHAVPTDPRLPFCASRIRADGHPRRHL